MQKKIPLGISVMLLVLLNSANCALADGIIIPEPPLEYPIIRYHNVTVEIKDQYAVTKIDQEFYNPYNETLVGKYIFPVPEGAFISNFTMTIGNESYQAETMNKSEARELFEGIVNESGDASLLEYLDQDLLALDIAISANTSLRTQICYEELLTQYGNMYRYVYVLSVERYSPVPIESVSITVNISSNLGIANVYSPTHSIMTEQVNSTNVVAKYEVKNAKPSTDFELYYTTTANFVGAGLLNYFDGEQGFLLLAFSPSSEELNITYIPKDIVFVIDKSGSMGGEKIEQAKEALKYVIQHLSPQDRFSIVSFDSNIYMFSSGLKEVNTTNIDEALGYVDNIQAGGTTNINDALLTGISIFNTSTFTNTTRAIIFLTDGLPTDGITNESQIVENVRTANINSEVCASIYVFGVGYDVNTYLLDKISTQNYGTSIYVKPDENLESALIEFYSKIAYPILTNITVEFAGIVVNETYPQIIPDLFKGTQLIVVSKYCGNSNVTVYLNGTTAGGVVNLTYQFTLSNTTYYNFIPRLWATRKIGDLLNKIRLEGETEELVNEIRALGMKYGIVTPYTSILIEAEVGTVTEGMTDSNAMRNTTGYDAVTLAGGTWTYTTTTKINIGIGGNIVIAGAKSFINLNGTLVDTSLLTNVTIINLTNQTMEEWLAANINITKEVVFGSEEYFALLNDEALAEILSKGKELVFYYNGEIIKISEQFSEHPSGVTPEVIKPQPSEESPPFPLTPVAFIIASAVLLSAFFAGTELGKYRLFAVLIVPIFAKLKKEDVLDHYTRGRIHGFIEANPGAHFNLIKRALELNNGTLSYHLGVLERSELIKHSNDGFKERFYPIRAEIPKKPYLSNTEEAILEQIKAVPGMTQKELKAKLNLSQPLLSYYTTKLAEQDFLEPLREGKEIRYYLKEKDEVGNEEGS